MTDVMEQSCKSDNSSVAIFNAELLAKTTCYVEDS